MADKKNQFKKITDLDSKVYSSSQAEYLPQKVEGYLDVMEKHWGEPDLEKVNTDLEKVVGSEAANKFPQALTAAVYTGDNVTNSMTDDAVASELPIFDENIDKLTALKNDKTRLPGSTSHKMKEGPYGTKRVQHFQQPVMNLLKIVRKLRDFSHLSEAYREKHMEVENLTLTIRKLYYILIFIKDQIKSVAGAEDDIHRLIAMIVKETKQWNRFVGRPELEKLKTRQGALKKDRDQLEKVFEIASKSILRKLSKMDTVKLSLNSGPRPRVHDRH